MRKVLLLICVLGMSCASWAQTNPSSWENLNTLHAGEKIQVVETTSKKISGTLVLFPMRRSPCKRKRARRRSRGKTFSA